MKRRNFLGAMGAFVALGIMRVRAASLPHYPPFVRDGCRITPVWRWSKPGERIYKLGHWVKEDGYFVEVVRGHWHLSTRMEEVDEEDSGESPKQLGYLETKWAAIQNDPSTWKQIDQ